MMLVDVMLTTTLGMTNDEPPVVEDDDEEATAPPPDSVRSARSSASRTASFVRLFAVLRVLGEWYNWGVIGGTLMGDAVGGLEAVPEFNCSPFSSTTIQLWSSDSRVGV